MDRMVCNVRRPIFALALVFVSGGCHSGNCDVCSPAIVTDTVLTVDRCHWPPATFEEAATVCEHHASMHLPRSFELAEVYASGVAADPGWDEWLYDATVLYADAAGQVHVRAPSIDERTFAFRCVLELPIK